MDEAPCALVLRDAEHRDGAGDVSGFEAGRVGGIDHARHMDDGVGPLRETMERVAVLQASADPFDSAARVLGAAGEGAYAMTRAQRRVE